MRDEKSVPQGRFGRLARLAAAGAKAGVGRVMGREADTSVLDTAEILGQLRGLAAKAGQMAAYVDGLVPEDHKDAYEKGMRSLLAAAPRSSSAEIRQTLEAELGGTVGELFSAWEDDPIASASIGQVHRARLLDGTWVAVKVQHPGIAAAVESDLENLGLLESAIGFTPARKFDPHRLFEEIRARFREELDYALEGERQEAFRRLHAGDPTIRIPAVVQTHSTRRVLTTEFVVGKGFEEACLAPLAHRRAWAETLWRFVYKGNLVGGMFNADPHPGNYLFGEGGQVTFLDFGCVQTLEEDRRRKAVALHRAALGRDEAGFLAGVRELMDTVPGSQHEGRVLTQFRDIYRPLTDAPFHITRPWASALLRQMKDLNKESRQAREREYKPLPSGILFFNRLQFGFYSVLARLDVEVDYAGVERLFLPAP